MSDISLKRTETTKLTIKKAMITNGKLNVEGEIVDLVKLLEDNFSDSIFDIAVAEKVDEDLEYEYISDEAVSDLDDK